MPQPFQVAKRRVQQQATPGGVIRQYRPMTDPSLPQAVQDAFRQMPDQVYSLRQQFGPAVLHVTGSGDPITVPVTPLTTGVGLSVRLTRPGRWVVTAAISLNIVGDTGQVFTGRLGTASPSQPFAQLPTSAQWNNPGDGQVMMHQSWTVISKNGDDIVRMSIEKDGGAGTSTVNPANSTLAATWQGNDT